MKEIAEYGEYEIKEFLIDSINNLNTLSKEIEWLTLDSEDEKNKYRSVKITLNGNEFKYSELSNYFLESDFLYTPEFLIISLYKIVLEFKEIGNIISHYTEEQKIILLEYINSVIDLVGKKSGFKFSLNYKEIILMELGLDYIDKSGDAKNETLALLELLLMKR